MLVIMSYHNKLSLENDICEKCVDSRLEEQATVSLVWCVGHLEKTAICSC